MLEKKSYASAKCIFALRSLTGNGTGFALNYLSSACRIRLIFVAGCPILFESMGGNK